MRASSNTLCFIKRASQNGMFDVDSVLLTFQNNMGKCSPWDCYSECTMVSIVPILKQLSKRR